MNLRHNILACLLTAATLLPLQSQAAPPDAREIAPGVLLLPGQLQPRHNPDGNSVILRGASGLLVVDSGRGGAHTRNLVQLLRQLGQPVEALLNTHWHLDHIGGNALLRSQFPGLAVHAHPALDTAIEGFHRESRAQLEGLVLTLAPGTAEHARVSQELDLLRNIDDLVAGEKVRGPGRWIVGGRTLERRVSTGAVTEGDVWLFDPGTRTLVAGDLVTLPVPLLDTACPETWQQTLSHLGSQDFKLLVPGHGAPLTPAQFKQYRRAYDKLLACAADKKKDDAACVDGWFEDAGSLVGPGEAAYGRELLAHYLQHSLRPQAPGRLRWCG